MTMASLSWAATAVGGRLYGDDADFVAVSTDTRSLRTGELFVALRGERFDAAEFLPAAAAAGAAGAMIEQISPAAIPQIEVADTRVALGALAHAWRQRFELPLIAVTGSNGKTTVKELIAAILRAAFPGDDAVLATAGNLNNDIGMPLTLLRLRPQHRAAVIEMGANHPGEIGQLAKIALPGIAVITNAARAHLEGFGSIEAVAQTKGQIVEHLGSAGTAVLNRDDAFYADWVRQAGSARIVSFGLQAAADYRAAGVRAITRQGRPGFTFELQTPAGSTQVALPLAGEHNIRNALAAAAATMAAGISLQAVQAGLAASRNVGGRMRTFRNESGAIILDDCYNANPDSVAAAIAALTALKGEPWLVFGDMGELGPDGVALHRAVGEQARAAGVRGLLCTGTSSRATAAGFGAGGRWFESPEQLEAALRQELRPGRNVLIKASRFMQFDRIVRKLEPAGGVPANAREGV